VTSLKFSPHRKEKNTTKAVVAAPGGASQISTAVVLTLLGPILIQAQGGKIVFCGMSSGVSSRKNVAGSTEKQAITETNRFLKSAQIASVKDAKVIQRASKQIKEYFSGKRRKFSLPIQLHGSDFQVRVWQRMLEIPYGHTVSYGDLARRAGRPGAARAVGSACNKNPLLLINPCHRVLAANGRLGGFALGLAAKKTMLKIEGVEF